MASITSAVQNLYNQQAQNVPLQTNLQAAQSNVSSSGRSLEQIAAQMGVSVDQLVGATGGTTALANQQQQQQEINKQSALVGKALANVENVGAYDAQRQLMGLPTATQQQTDIYNQVTGALGSDLVNQIQANQNYTLGDMNQKVWQYSPEMQNQISSRLANLGDLSLPAYGDVQRQGSAAYNMASTPTYSADNALASQQATNVQQTVQPSVQTTPVNITGSGGVTTPQIQSTTLPSLSLGYDPNVDYSLAIQERLAQDPTADVSDLLTARRAKIEADPNLAQYMDSQLRLEALYGGAQPITQTTQPNMSSIITDYGQALADASKADLELAATQSQREIDEAVLALEPQYREAATSQDVQSQIQAKRLAEIMANRGYGTGSEAQQQTELAVQNLQALSDLSTQEQAERDYYARQGVALQQDLAGQIAASNLGIGADVLGMQIDQANTDRSFQAQQELNAFNQAITEAGLTGVYNGMSTLAGQQALMNLELSQAEIDMIPLKIEQLQQDLLAGNISNQAAQIELDMLLNPSKYQTGTGTTMEDVNYAQTIQAYNNYARTLGPMSIDDGLSWLAQNEARLIGELGEDLYGQLLESVASGFPSESPEPTEATPVAGIGDVDDYIETALATALVPESSNTDYRVNTGEAIYYNGEYYSLERIRQQFNAMEQQGLITEDQIIAAMTQLGLLN